MKSLDGTHRKYGCKRGTKCLFFHPDHCPTSISDKSCFSENCTLVHPVGTKRRKPTERATYRLDHSSNRETRPANSNQTQSKNRGSQNPGRSRLTSRSEEVSSQVPPQSDSFLEIRSLLTNLQSTFQKEIDALKTSITGQESRLATLAPSMNQHAVPQ